MLFNSFPFILLFLPITLGVFILLARQSDERPALVWLVVASLFFYGWWNPVYLTLIGTSILTNFALGRALESRLRSRALLVLGVGLNLGLLGWFKYAHFVLENVNLLLAQPVHLGEIVLPLAISFFTFQQIAFLVDTFHGTTHESGFLKYALFVLFFPQLIAGPIVRHQDLVGQFDRLAIREALHEKLGRGLVLFTLGLVKKVVLADALARLADPVFAQANSQVPTLVDAWSGLLAYSLQIYFDFSGYSDMAIGLALMFGFHIPNNFNAPYRATSLRDFWRRWHITLSSFLRDYLYIPLGGSRRGFPRQALAVLVTMLLGGLWHGASWNFVLWGAMHGVGIGVSQAAARRPARMPAGLGWLLTFLFVLMSWVLFRAEGFGAALHLYRGLFGLAAPGAVADLAGRLEVIAPAVAIAIFGPTTYCWVHERLRPRLPLALAVGLLFVVTLLVLGDQGHDEFIYFQF